MKRLLLLLPLLAACSDPVRPSAQPPIRVDFDAADERGADLELTKRGPETAAQGEEVTWTLVVNNRGPGRNDGFTVTDRPPRGWSYTSSEGCEQAGADIVCTSYGLDDGESVEWQITAAVPQEWSHTEASNDARITYTATPDPDPDNDSAGWTIATSPKADLEVEKRGPDRGAPGEEITWTVVVNNRGPSNNSGLQITDAPPGPGWSFTTPDGCSQPDEHTIVCTSERLGAGESMAWEVSAVVPREWGYTEATNRVEITYTATPDPKADNDIAEWTFTTGAYADVHVIKRGPLTVVAGATIVYDVLVGNAGFSSAHDVVLTDEVPTGLTNVAYCEPAAADCSAAPSWLPLPASIHLGTLESGASRHIRIRAIVLEGAPRQLRNVATVSSTTADPVIGNNRSETRATVLPPTVRRR